MKTLRNIHLLFGIAIPFLLQTNLGAERSATAFDNHEIILKKGERFSDPDLSYDFVAPLTIYAVKEKRGEFYLLELRSYRSADLFGFITAFRLRRPDQLAVMAAILPSNCALPPLPSGENYRLDVDCQASTQRAAVERSIRIERSGELLHIFYLSFPPDRKQPASQLKATIEKNMSFQLRPPPT